MAYAHLPFDVVGVNRQLLAGLEVKIDDFKIRRIVHQKIVHGFVTEAGFFEQLYFFHCESLLGDGNQFP